MCAGCRVLSAPALRYSPGPPAASATAEATGVGGAASATMGFVLAGPAPKEVEGCKKMQSLNFMASTQFHSVSCGEKMLEIRIESIYGDIYIFFPRPTEAPRCGLSIRIQPETLDGTSEIST